MTHKTPIPPTNSKANVTRYSPEKGIFPDLGNPKRSTQENDNSRKFLELNKSYHDENHPRFESNLILDHISSSKTAIIPTEANCSNDTKPAEIKTPYN